MLLEAHQKTVEDLNSAQQNQQQISTSIIKPYVNTGDPSNFLVHTPYTYSLSMKKQSICYGQDIIFSNRILNLASKFPCSSVNPAGF